MKNRISRKTREQFEDLLGQAYDEGFKDGQAATSTLNEFLVAGQVKYIGNDPDYIHFTTGNTYEVIDKMIHPEEIVPILRVIDDRRSKGACSLIRPDTVRLFEAVKQPEQIPIAKESPIKNTKYSL